MGGWAGEVMVRTAGSCADVLDVFSLVQFCCLNDLQT